MIRYWHPSDEDQVVGQLQTTFFSEDQNAEWWVGIQRCAATLAIAASVAIIASQTVVAESWVDSWQDDPAGKLTATVDEYFWINPAVNNTGINLWPQQSVFEQNEIVPQPAAFQPDEDFWQNPTPPVAGALYQNPSLWVDEQTPTLFGQYDEDFWQNPTAPVPGYLLVQLPLGDPEEIPAGTLHGQYDEDFWQNPTPPVVGSLYQPLPYWFDSNEIASGYGQYDEDFWINPAISCYELNLYPLPFLFDGSEIVPQPAVLSPDEDFWVIPAPITYVVNIWPQQWSLEQNDQLKFPSSTSIATDTFSESELIIVAYNTLQTSLFPDTILLDIASDVYYPIPYQRGAVRVLLSRQALGREPFQYVTPQQAALRTASITALFALRSAQNSTFATLLAQEQAIFALTGF